MKINCLIKHHENLGLYRIENKQFEVELDHIPNTNSTFAISTGECAGVYSVSAPIYELDDAKSNPSITIILTQK
jgi:hypothetical protein